MDDITTPAARTVVYNNKSVVYGGRAYNEILERLNHERMLFQLPVIVVLVAMMVVSVLGNILVVLVYKQSLKSSVASLFITLLALTDLTTALCIPFNIHDMLNPYMHAAPVACKIGRFLEAFSSVLSGNLLTCVALDRYVHVISPLRKVSFQQAKSVVVCVTMLALSLAWPQLILAGRKTAKTPVEGIFGEDCSFRDRVYNSIYTLLHQASLAIAFFIGLCITVVCYCRIYYVIWRKRNHCIGEQVYSIPCSENLKSAGKRRVPSTLSSPSNQELSETEAEEEHDVDACPAENGTSVFKRGGDLSVNLSDISASDQTVENGAQKNRRNRIRNTNKRNASQRARVSTLRITRIMAVVTLAVILSYVPYLLVNVFKNIGLFFRPDMGKAEDLVYEFCTKSQFMNAVANPLIYSAMNPTFRSDVKKILNRLFCHACFKS